MSVKARSFQIDKMAYPAPAVVFTSKCNSEHSQARCGIECRNPEPSPYLREVHHLVKQRDMRSRAAALPPARNFAGIA